jgi:hypothetical protein
MAHTSTLTAAADVGVAGILWFIGKPGTKKLYMMLIINSFNSTE